MAKYYVDPNYIHQYPNSVVNIGDRVVSLNGEQRIDVAETKQRPAYKRVIPAATQADLKELHGLGTKYVLVDNSEPTAAPASK